MKSYYILSAIGKDRPGIVADVSEAIYECGGNIEDSNMGLLRTHFALLTLFSADMVEVDQKFPSRLKRLEQEKHLAVSFRAIYADSGTWVDSVKSCTYVEAQQDTNTGRHYIRVITYLSKTALKGGGINL